VQLPVHPLVDEPPVPKRPAGQKRQLPNPEAAWYSPAGQSVHADAPADENLPAVHVKEHDDWPVLGLYLPAAQFEHDEAADAEYLPAGHAAYVAEREAEGQ
jgi:hypothetical protein